MDAYSCLERPFAQIFNGYALYLPILLQRFLCISTECIMRMPNYKVSIMWWSIYHTISANNTSNSSKTRTKRKSYYKVYRSNSMNTTWSNATKPIQYFYPCRNCCNCCTRGIMAFRIYIKSYNRRVMPSSNTSWKTYLE